MKTKILFLLILIISLTATSQIKKTFYNDGKLSGEGKMVSEKKQGDWVLYHKTGEVLAKGAYKDNKEEGYWEAFIPNGKLFFKGNYANGNRIGKWFEATSYLVEFYLVKNYDNAGNLLDNNEIKTVYKSGELFATVKLVDGEKDGIYKAYYENGNIKGEGKYVKGNQVGEWKYYYDNSQLSSISIFIDGELDGLAFEYFRDGSTKSIINYKLDDLNGELIEFFEDGTLKSKVNYLDHKRNGEGFRYLEKGKLLFRGVYKDDEISGQTTEYEYYKNGNPKSKREKNALGANGETRFYREDGSISEIWNYKNDKTDGSFKSFYDNGNLESLSYYNYGSKTGEWKKYYRNRKLKSVDNYAYDKQTGASKEYFEDGKLKASENYSQDKITGAAKYYEKTKGGTYYLYEKGSYSSGKENGTWYRYFSDGDIQMKRTYSYGKKTEEINATSLYFKNISNKELQVLIRYKNLKDVWETVGWFNFKPGEEGKVRSVLGPKFLYYAQAIKSNHYWGGEQSRTYKGKSYKMKERFISEGVMARYDGKYTMSLK